MDKFVRLGFEDYNEENNDENEKISKIISETQRVFFNQNVLNILTLNSKNIKISNKKYLSYRYSPHLVSLEHLGDSNYWSIILFVNGFSTKNQFENFDTLLIPSIESIQKIWIENIIKKF